jgi:hypothetical protein
MTLSETDFELANAYHDGELDPAAAERFRARLAAEPALRHALAEIEEVSVALRPLRPLAAGAVAGGLRGQWATGRIAAAIAAAGVLVGGLFLLLSPDRQRTPLDLHQGFVAQSYEVRPGLRPVAAANWLGLEPDLSSANLTLVDAAGDLENEFYLHYAGVNGCRLTFGAHVLAPDLPAPTKGLLADAWTDGELYYTLIAVGMDTDRFKAITRLLQERTRIERLVDDTVLAVRRATRDATPCA